jgi:hypothetical protein
MEVSLDDAAASTFFVCVSFSFRYIFAFAAPLPTSQTREKRDENGSEKWQPGKEKNTVAVAY